MDAASAYIIDSGYKRLYLSGRKMYEHRAIFLMHHGFLPRYIDHIDMNRANNLICNLRECTKAQNAMNQKGRSDRFSRYKGVCWYKRDKKWHAQICVNGKRKHLGFYKSEIEAALVYNKAALSAFGEFAYINNVGESCLDS